MNNFNKSTVETHNKQPKDFSHIKVGQWVKRKLDNKWYQREKGRLKDFLSSILWFRLENNEYCGSQYPQNWDLTDIRDTNPDQPVETHEEVEESGLTWKQGIENTTGWKLEVYQKQFPQVTVEEINEEHYPITKDNIVEVLEYNGIDKDRYEHKCDHILVVTKDLNNSNVFYFNNPLWLQLVEVYFGKLKPIPKPKFDFVQYLLDNSFKVWGIDDYIEWSADLNGIRVWSEANAIFTNGGLRIKPTKDNADILIAMSKLSEELK